MSFTEQQPKHGDIIMHCGHPDRNKLHWFQYDAPLQFQRPDGTYGEAQWFAACAACFCKHGERVSDFVRGDDRWTGDEPVIEREALS